MADSINFKREIQSDVEGAVERVTAALKAEGFGILNRINLHEKFEEKLGKKTRPVVILGACNPQIAYDAYRANTDVASLLPCNAVVRELDEGRVSVELAKPTAMMRMLESPELVEAARSADRALENALEKL